MAKITRPKPIKKRAPVKRNNKRKQPKQGFPLVAVLIALSLIGFIAYFIFSVETPIEEPIALVKPKPVIKEEVLPEKPQPKWDYVDTLKTKEVVVDIPKETKSSVPYQMQCGSFKDKGDSESLKAKIAFQGLESTIKKTGDWYRVILGPYERKRVAEKERHKLQRAKINGCQIWLWR